MKQSVAPKRIPTTERLAEALEGLGDPRLRNMVRLARQGHYDDYKTTLHAPLRQLYVDLMELGHDAMAERVKNGDFDCQRWEAEEWFRKEGKALFEQSGLFGGRRGKEHKTV